jgi:hypothetical protein
MKVIWITDAHYISDYKIELTFNDGVRKEIDFNFILDKHKKTFAPLRDQNIFRNFKLDGWTLTWKDGSIDVSPESLYEQALLS